MSEESHSRSPAGIYHDDDDVERLVHEYTDEDYDISDIHHSFGIGRLQIIDGVPVLELDGGEVRRLKVLADAESFDHLEDFIMMCLDIYRFASPLGAGPHRFVERVR